MRTLAISAEPIDQDQAPAAAALANLDNFTSGNEAPQRDEFLEVYLRRRATGPERLVGLAEPIGELERPGSLGGAVPRPDSRAEPGNEGSERCSFAACPGAVTQKDIERIAGGTPPSRFISYHQTAADGCQAPAGQSGHATHKLSAHPMQDEPPSQFRAAVLAQDGVIKNIRAHRTASLPVSNNCTNPRIVGVASRKVA